jgi:hypothetical protein
MHISLDSALGQQRRLNQVGESITQIAPDPAAAYSLRSLTGSDPKVVRVRRGSDNDERDFTASEVSSGALTSYVNAQVVAPLDIQALTATGRDGAYQIAKAAYSLRSLGTRQATVAATGDTVTRANGKYVCQVRRNVNGDLKSFTADEVSDGTLTSFVNESFTSSLPLDVAGSAAAAYGLRNLSSSYSGNVVEVRRASDDTTQNFTAAEVTDGTLLAFVNDSSVATVNTQDFTDGSSWSETGGGSARFTTNSVTGGTGARQVISTYQFKAGTTYKITLDGNPNALNTAQCGVHLNRVSDNALTALVSNRTFAFNLDTTFTPSDDSFLRIRTSTGTVDWTYSNFTVQVVTSDGHVKTWYDQSGNSNNATQATPANQPKIVSAGALVTGGLDFDGTDDRLDIDFGSNLSQPNSIFMVHQSGTTLGEKNDFFDELGTTGQRTLLDQTGSNYRIFAGSSATSSLSSDTNKNLITAIYNGASSILAKNGTAESALNPSTQSISSTSAIGFSENATQYYQGTMQEFIIYNSDQSDKRRAIEESIATANGITLGSFSRDGFVKTWYDQSVSDQSDAGSTPTGNHATQATADNQPKIVDGGALVTDGGLLFNGDTTFLNTGSSLSLGTEFFVTSVLNLNTEVDSSGSIIGNSAGGGDDRLFIDTSNDKLAIRNGGVNTISSLILSKTQDNLSTYQASSSSFTFVLDGNTDAKSALSTGQSFRYIGGGTGFNLSANMKELIIYDTDQTDNRTAIEANIGEAYSIDLPSGVDPGFDQVDGFVETWYDQSGNGNDATQATADNQPKIVSDGVLESDGIHFDGSDDVLTASGTYSRSGADLPLSMLSVFKQDVEGVQYVNSISRGAAGNPFNRHLTRTTSFDYGRRDDSGAAKAGQGLDPAINTKYLFSTFDSGTTASGFVNGSSAFSNVDVDLGTQTINQIDIGAFNSSTVQFPFNGKIQEFILYNSDQTAKRTALETNIASEYGITLS